MIAAILAALFFGSASISQGAQDLKLYVFNCGEIEFLNEADLSPGFNQGKSKRFTNTCYLIKNKSRYLLWDTGVNDSLADTKDWFNVPGVGTPSRVRLKKKLMEQLKGIGVTPAQIEFVVFSHMHPDHTGNANSFSASKVIMQKPEFDAAFGKEPGKYRYHRQSYELIKKEKVIQIDGDHDVFGDGSTTIIKAHGHSPGHQVLMIRLPKTGPIILSGDLYYCDEYHKKNLISTLNYNSADAKAAITKIDKIAKDQDAQIWVQHDIELQAKVKKSPSFYQ